MFNNLFNPIKIKGMELRNRVILPAMGTRMADRSSEITNRLIDYHVARTEGGCGLNIVEVASVHTPSAPANFVSISEDKYILGHKKLTDAIHKAGGKAGIQLWQGSIAVGMDPKARIFVVNDTPFGDFTMPAIKIDEIKEIVSCYGKAARRSVEAGYDCIEFHCAHNYLPHSFLSGGINRREDEYGGDLRGRAKFPLECIRAIRENIPADMPLFMRIGAHDDCLENGMTSEETIEFCKMAGQAGVDVLDVSRGNIITSATVYEVPPIDIPVGFNVDNAARIRKETGILTIAVGRINTADLAESILEADKADMIIMGRAQLADPDFCNKAKEGRIDEIIHCCACNQGCFDGFCDVANRDFITCLRNPAIGHEGDYRIEKASKEKNVWIAGAGIAGLEAARILKMRGHRVTVFEKSNSLGGQFVTAGQAPGKAEMKNAVLSMAKWVEKLGVDIKLNTPLTKDMIVDSKPDEIILAIGASPIDIKLKGSEHKNIYLANDLLNGLDEVRGETLIIGGGLVGLEAADYVASRGHKVSVVEMQDKAGKDLGQLRAISVMQKMHELKVDIYTNAKCEYIDSKGVVVNKDGEEATIPCENVIIAVGSKSNPSDGLVKACEENSIACRLVGDAKSARRAINAVEEAFLIAMEV